MNRNATKVSAIINLITLCTECVVSLVCCITVACIWSTTVAHDMTMRDGLVTVSYVLPIVFLLSLFLIFRQGKIYKIASRPMSEFRRRKIYRWIHFIFTVLLCVALAVSALMVMTDGNLGHAADMLAVCAWVAIGIHVLCLLTMTFDAVRSIGRYNELSEEQRAIVDSKFVGKKKSAKAKTKTAN